MNISRIPPHNVDAEKVVIGATLINAKIVPMVMSKLDSDDFYVDAHKRIFDAIHRLFISVGGVDMVSVLDKLSVDGVLDSVGGPAYLSSLNDVIGSRSSVSRSCTIIKNHSKARGVISAASDAVDKCYSGGDAGDVINSLTGDIAKVNSGESNNCESVLNISKRVLDTIEGRHNGSIPAMGLTTGFIDLDHITGGLNKSDLVLLAGRPSMGKTTLAMNIITNAAMEGARVLAFSLEMSRDKLVEKQVSSFSRENIKSIQRGDLFDDSWPKITTAIGKISNLKMSIDDSASLSIAQIQARSKMAAMQGGVDLIMVDYLQLVRAKAESREREVSEVSAGLKALAKDLQVPVIALSQLSRRCEDRRDKRPLMSDLRDSGSLEQDADLVIFIYRDEVYNTSEDNPLRGAAEILVRKNRCGEVGEIRLYFDGTKCSFSNMVHR